VESPVDEPVESGWTGGRGRREREVVRRKWEEQAVIDLIAFDADPDGDW
jgi:hypothetical protein